jgi:hypothetical protein
LSARRQPRRRVMRSPALMSSCDYDGSRPNRFNTQNRQAVLAKALSLTVPLPLRERAPIG